MGRNVATNIRKGATVVPRRIVDGMLDHIRYQIDSRPSGGLYQPNPWRKAQSARRAVGTSRRGEVIRRVAVQSGSHTVLDIGANHGYFAVDLAMTGLRVLALDSDQRSVRMMIHHQRRLPAGALTVVSGDLTPGAGWVVPQVDMVLLLSVWHHWVRAFGLDDATDLLAQVWDRTGSVLMFDTGQDEMPEAYSLPDMKPDPVGWLRGYLASTCAEGAVQELGTFPAFAPGATERSCPVQRSLFAVFRL